MGQGWSLGATIQPTASLVAQLVKKLPAMLETLGWEDPLEKARQPTPIFLPGEFHGQRSLVGYSPWGHKESDMTEQLTHTLSPLGVPGGSSD